MPNKFIPWQQRDEFAIAVLEIISREYKKGRDMNRPKMNPRISFHKPFTLDTQDKVDAANEMRESMNCTIQWRLGDSCWYEPFPNETMKYMSQTPPWEDIKRWALEAGFRDDGYGDPACSEWDDLRRFAHYVALDAVEDYRRKAVKEV